MFSREFKQEAVELVTTREVSAAQASRDPGIHATVLRRWVRASEADGPAALPAHEKLPPDQEELRNLRREVSELKAERDILKNPFRAVARLRAQETGCCRVTLKSETRRVRRHFLSLIARFGCH